MGPSKLRGYDRGSSSLDRSLKVTEDSDGVTRQYYAGDVEQKHGGWLEAE